MKMCATHSQPPGRTCSWAARAGPSSRLTAAKLSSASAAMTVVGMNKVDTAKVASYLKVKCNEFCDINYFGSQA